MKINKNLYKVLGLSLFTSNFSIYSSLATSNMEIPNRYQTLEGEYITLDDSIEGELHEIEIFGNTAQDENNLEDIQSVGDLYVDENGDPILDSQGREQYKIDIISTNSRNLLNESTYINNTLPSENINNLVQSQYDGFFTQLIEIKENKTFSYVVDNYSGYAWNSVWTFDEDGNVVRANHLDSQVPAGVKKTVTFSSNEKYFTVKVPSSFIEQGSTVQVNEGEYVFPYSKYKDSKDYFENKKTILLPTQLQKVGDVSDRLYWDNEKGKYIIEKNIKKGVLHGVENWVLNTTITNTSEYLCFCVSISDAYGNIGATNIINNKFTNRKVHQHTIEEEGIGFVGGTQLFFRIHQSRLYDSSVSSFKNYLKDNNVEIFYWLNNSEIIETNISSKLEIPTYAEKTYIYAETKNGINPTIKVTIDRLPNICEEAVEDAITNPSIEKIAQARSLVNQMNECDFKEELQRRLNEILSMDDLVLERKNSTSNVDVYIKSENSLHMALSTNQITFEDYSGLTEIEKDNALVISINSSLPYELNAYMLDEIYNSDKNKQIDMNRLNIKDDLNTADTDYKEFNAIGTKLTLNDSCDAGNGIKHNIDLKLKGDQAYLLMYIKLL